MFTKLKIKIKKLFNMAEEQTGDKAPEQKTTKTNFIPKGFVKTSTAEFTKEQVTAMKAPEFTAHYKRIIKKK